MVAPQQIDAVGADFHPGFAQELVGEQPTAHADLAVDAPDGQRDPLAVERILPGEYVLVDAIDQRAVEIEEEHGFASHHVSPVRLACTSDVGGRRTDRNRFNGSFILA